MDGEDSAPVRAHGLGRRLLLHRAVVPQAGRARGRRLEHAPVSCGHRVLLRLRRLRRPPHPARVVSSSAPRAARPARTDNADGTTTHRYRGEDIHDFAWTASPDFIDLTQRVRAPDAAAGGHAAAAAARAPRPGRSLLRDHRRHAEAIRRVVRRRIRTATSPLSIPPSRARATGWIPDALHRPSALAGAAARADARDARPRTRPGISGGTRMVATNEFEHAWMDEGINTYATARVLDEAMQSESRRVAVLRRVRSVVVSRHPVDAHRQRPPRRLSAQQRGGRASGRRRSVLAGNRHASSATTRRRSGCTRSNGGSDGR